MDIWDTIEIWQDDERVTPQVVYSSLFGEPAPEDITWLTIHTILKDWKAYSGMSLTP